jgi:2-iminobutanoate/2-iminopropanoate deaminase
MQFVGQSQSSFSRAVKVGDRVYSSGVQGLDKTTGRLVDGDFSSRARKCVENLSESLSEAGSSLNKLLSMKVYLRNLRDREAFDNVLKEFFQGKFPARTTLEVNRLQGDSDLEVDGIAAVDMASTQFLGVGDGFSPAVRHGNYLYISGDFTVADLRNLQEEKDCESEVRLCFDRIRSILETAGMSLERLFSTRVYVRNMRDRAIVNKISTQIYKANPLRVIVECARFTNHHSLMIEGEAYDGDFEILSTTKGQKPTGPFSQGVRIGNFVYCSGVRPINPATGSLVEGDFSARAIQCFKNLDAILVAGGASWQDVFEVRFYMRNLADLPIVYRLLSDLRKAKPMPMGTAIEICRLNEDYEKGWKPNHDIEIQCSAYSG